MLKTTIYINHENIWGGKFALLGTYQFIGTEREEGKWNG